MHLKTRAIPQHSRLHLRISVKYLVGYGKTQPRDKATGLRRHSPLMLQIASLRTPNSRAKRPILTSPGILPFRLDKFRDSQKILS
jgi:hypothetical protein